MIFGDLPDERLAASTEAAAYFVVSEALANVAKYAQASAVRVSVRRDGDRLAVDVDDDGVGGADPARGSGLRGLLDRPRPDDPLAELTPREREVLSLMAAGLTDKGISERLLRDSQDRRDARRAHLRQARDSCVGRRQPARTRRARVPEIRLAHPPRRTRLAP